MQCVAKAGPIESDRERHGEAIRDREVSCSFEPPVQCHIALQSPVAGAKTFRHGAPESFASDAPTSGRVSEVYLLCLDLDEVDIVEIGMVALCPGPIPEGLAT